MSVISIFFRFFNFLFLWKFRIHAYNINILRLILINEFVPGIGFFLLAHLSVLWWNESRINNRGLKLKADYDKLWRETIGFLKYSMCVSKCVLVCVRIGRNVRNVTQRRKSSGRDEKREENEKFKKRQKRWHKIHTHTHTVTHTSIRRSEVWQRWSRYLEILWILKCFHCIPFLYFPICSYASTFAHDV